MKKIALDLTKQQLNSAEMNQLVGGTEKTKTRTRTKTKSN